MLHISYSVLSFFAKGEDADMVSGGNLLLAGTGITPKATTDIALWGIMSRRAVLFSGDLHPILPSA